MEAVSITKMLGNVLLESILTSLSLPSCLHAITANRIQIMKQVSFMSIDDKESYREAIECLVYYDPFLAGVCYGAQKTS